MAITKKSELSKCWQGYEKGNIIFCWWEYKLAQPIAKEKKYPMKNAQLIDIFPKDIQMAYMYL